jgi:large subunit ribosomal protein L23
MNDLTLYNVLVGPHITEKATMALEQGNRVAFKIATWANKGQVKAAVEKMFKVNVLDVKTTNMKGKEKRFGKTMGRRKNWKKALVRLEEGQSIDFQAAE